jgi:hypothetical protein
MLILRSVSPLINQFSLGRKEKFSHSGKVNYATCRNSFRCQVKYIFIHVTEDEKALKSTFVLVSIQLNQAQISKSM